MIEYGVLFPKGMRRKPRALVKSLVDSGRQRHQVSLMDEYKPCKTLLVYGWGGAAQQRAIKQHDGNYVAFDLGYWGRAGHKTRKWRVSINGFHSPELVKATQPDRDRLKADGICAGTDCRNDGYILLIGNTPKSLRVIEPNWTAKTLKDLRIEFPDKKIVYRPKPGRPPETGIVCDGVSNEHIEEAIKGAFLVVCRHSNVAVDCAIHGVPVVCMDGAASSIYPNKLSEYKKQPTRDQRQEFLEKLSLWQWSVNEISSGHFWPWMERQLELLDS